MAENSKIQWTDHTVNFWTGCKKVSPGCKFCYMFRDQERYGKEPTDVLQVAQKTINKVLKQAKPGDKIFTCSWSDFFIEEADEWRAWAWGIIRDNPHLNWQILTKRPERIKDCLPPDWGDGWQQVWMGVSVETGNQLHRVKTLIELAAFPGIKTTFISAEPLLGPLEFDINGRKDENDPYIISLLDGIDWVIVGGESGNDNGDWRYRPNQVDWMLRIVEQCKQSNTPVFVKQMGTHLAQLLKLNDRHGGDISEFPCSLQIREFPKTIIL